MFSNQLKKYREWIKEWIKIGMAVGNDSYAGFLANFGSEGLWVRIPPGTINITCLSLKAYAKQSLTRGIKTLVTWTLLGHFFVPRA
jgi:hypothetical protein